MNVSLAREGRGQPLNFISQILDITARKRAEESLAASAERLALRVSKLGVWRHNLQTRATEWDARMFAIFGLTPSEHAPTHEQILGRVVDADRAQVWRSWNALPSLRALQIVVGRKRRRDFLSEVDEALFDRDACELDNVGDL